MIYISPTLMHNTISGKTLKLPSDSEPDGVIAVNGFILEAHVDGKALAFGEVCRHRVTLTEAPYTTINTSAAIANLITERWANIWDIYRNPDYPNNYWLGWCPTLKSSVLSPTQLPTGGLPVCMALSTDNVVMRVKITAEIELKLTSTAPARGGKARCWTLVNENESTFIDNGSLQLLT